MDTVEHNGTHIESEPSTDRMHNVKAKAKELAASARHAAEGTPPWVWALIGGVILLAVGIFAAGQYRARHRH